ncbi:MAG: acyl carrier protein [Anaerovoracaceae bacterium]
MTNERKIELISEVLEVEIEDLTPETKLSDLDEWDSIALISFLAMMDDEFDRIIKGSIVKEQKTIADLMALMEE